MLSVRADRPHVRDVSFEDFFHLTPADYVPPGPTRRTMQARRWLALLELVNAFRIRDEETWRHCTRVRQHALAFAQYLELNRAETRAVGMAALLHDVGKIAISDAVLRKEGRLSEDEFGMMRMHPEVGERLVHPLLGHVAVVAGIRHHHERFDGLGYPDGLAGSDIPLTARLISVADVFDALTNVRPYRKHPLTRLEAIAVIETQSSGQLDPDLASAFARMIRSAEDTVVEGRPALRRETLAGVAPDGLE
jgi:HD-GYP domain-containing protein (c-di-GMP phosphodiesterase class II)